MPALLSHERCQSQWPADRNSEQSIWKGEAIQLGEIFSKQGRSYKSIRRHSNYDGFWKTRGRSKIHKSVFIQGSRFGCRRGYFLSCKSCNKNRRRGMGNGTERRHRITSSIFTRSKLSRRSNPFQMSFTSAPRLQSRARRGPASKPAQSNRITPAGSLALHPRP